MTPAPERRAIVLGITADLAFAAGALIAGLARNGLDPQVTVVILHEGLDAQSGAAFRRLWPRVEFRPYPRDRMLARLGLGERPAGRLATVLERFSTLVLAKLDLPDLLDDFDRCVWLDADLLVQGPVEGLWDFGAMAWRPLADGAFRRRDGIMEVMGHLVRQPDLPLPNGGVLGVSRALRDIAGCGAADLYALARELLEQTPTQTPDELAFYFLAASRGVPVTLWPMALNHPVRSPGTRGATLLHAIGPHKFWNATPLIDLFPAWAADQARWVAAGGAPYGGPLLLAEVHSPEPADVLRAAQRRAEWLELYDRLRPDLPAGLQLDPRLERKQAMFTLAGQPAERQLRLGRHPNPRRIWLDLALPPAQRQAAEAALRGAVRDLRGGEGGMLHLPLAELAAALGAVAAALGLPR